MRLSMSSSSSSSQPAHLSHPPSHPPSTIGLRMKKRQYHAVCSSSVPRPDGEATLNLDRVKVAIQQDKRSMYSCSNYIKRRRLELLTEERKNATYTKTTVFDSGDVDGMCVDHYEEEHHHDQYYYHDEDKLVDPTCRQKMCEWSYKLCDHFRLDREIVAVSMSYVDRFLDKYSYCDRTTFKLVAMTTLYMANKIYGHESYDNDDHCCDDVYTDKKNSTSFSQTRNNSNNNIRRLTTYNLSQLSRGEFDTTHITDMELMILQTLEWKLHPPTTKFLIHAFYDHYKEQQQQQQQQQQQHKRHRFHDDDDDDIYDRAMFFAELAVYDYALVTKDRSLIAAASLMNAMEGMTLKNNADETSKFFDCVIKTYDLVDDKINKSNAVDTIRTRLWDIYGISAQYKDDYCSYLHDERGSRNTSTTTTTARKTKGTIVNATCSFPPSPSSAFTTIVPSEADHDCIVGSSCSDTQRLTSTATKTVSKKLTTATSSTTPSTSPVSVVVLSSHSAACAVDAAANAMSLSHHGELRQRYIIHKTRSY